MTHAPRLLVSMFGLTLAAAGCGGKQVEEAPPPAPEVSAPVNVPAPVSTPIAVDPAPAPDTRPTTLAEPIHFGLDRADLTPQARATLAAKVEILRSSPGLTLRIDGHADERGSDEYNLALSKRRAAEARRFMMDQGIEAARLDAVGYGEEQPLDPAATEGAWAMNRRADFQVTRGAISQR
jgi:peptidoglycan-associated lipoprotein